MYAAVSVGFTAFTLTFSDFFGKLKVFCRRMHSYSILLALKIPSYGFFITPQEGSFVIVRFLWIFSSSSAFLLRFESVQLVTAVGAERLICRHGHAAGCAEYGICRIRFSFRIFFFCL